MKILVIGGGGREHALAWRLRKDGHAVIAAPGNPGIAEVAECVAIGVGELDRLVALAVERAVDLVVVGPEAPLVAGLADRLRAAGVATFGPGQAGAALEGSKIVAKRFFARHGIPSARFHECGDLAAVDRALAELGDRVVVKADGLAAGKGVVVCAAAGEARAAAAAMLAGRFGEAGKRVIVEQRLTGRELSVMAVTDGRRHVVLPPAEDHKTLLDGDRGPNTGGMGTASPCGWLPADLLARVDREILSPTVAGLQADGVEFRGVLYAGVMVDEDGAPWLLEYNVRFGDPETQPVMARLGGDLGALLAAAAAGALGDQAVDVAPEAAVCVVMAAAGYPEAPRTGDLIAGLDAARAAGALVFHAGTAHKGDALVTAGGRVLGVTATGPTIEDARARAYRAVAQIDFAGAQYRRDIGRRGAAQEETR
jgi:phosphoribosylamine---glycine ligase